MRKEVKFKKYKLGENSLYFLKFGNYYKYSLFIVKLGKRSYQA